MQECGEGDALFPHFSYVPLVYCHIHGFAIESQGV